jgi:hypothetical protein
MMSVMARTCGKIATVLAVASSVLVPAPALAAGSNMPWERPLQQILFLHSPSRRSRPAAGASADVAIMELREGTFEFLDNYKV